MTRAVTRLDNAVKNLLAMACEHIDQGVLPAAQLALAYQGELIASEAYGACDTSSRFHMYSAGKPAVSLALMQLASQRYFDINAPVKDILDSFGYNGKHTITVSHVLLHTSGFPDCQVPLNAWLDRPARLEAYKQWGPPTHTPGTQFSYHPTSAHWVLADIITEATGQPYNDVIAELVLEPVGCSNWFSDNITHGSRPPGGDMPAVPAGEDRTLNSDRAPGSNIPIGNTINAVTIGTKATDDALKHFYGVDKLPDFTVTSRLLEALNMKAFRGSYIPGGGAVACASEVALWYQALMHNKAIRNKADFLSPRTLEDAFKVRVTYPNWMGVSVNRSRAFVLAGDDGNSALRGFGHGASREAFGHVGAKGQIAWADPVSGLSFAYFTNGLEENEVIVNQRAAALSTAAHHAAHHIAT